MAFQDGWHAADSVPWTKRFHANQSLSHGLAVEKGE